MSNSHRQLSPPRSSLKSSSRSPRKRSYSPVSKRDDRSKRARGSPTRRSPRYSSRDQSPPSRYRRRELREQRYPRPRRDSHERRYSRDRDGRDTRDYYRDRRHSHSRDQQDSHSSRNSHERTESRHWSSRERLHEFVIDLNSRETLSDRLPGDASAKPLFGGAEGVQFDRVEMQRTIFEVPLPERAVVIKRDIVRPEDVVVVRKPGEGSRPLFARSDVAVNRTEEELRRELSPNTRDRLADRERGWERLYLERERDLEERIGGYPLALRSRSAERLRERELLVPSERGLSPEHRRRLERDLEIRDLMVEARLREERELLAAYEDELGRQVMPPSRVLPLRRPAGMLRPRPYPPGMVPMHRGVLLHRGLMPRRRPPFPPRMMRPPFVHVMAPGISPVPVPMVPLRPTGYLPYQ